MDKYDVLIIGGGAAGLSAALILARCCRSVLVLDAGHPRNEYSRSVNGFLTRDGITPLEFLALAREQFRKYPDVHFRTEVVAELRISEDGFDAHCQSGAAYRGAKALLATGLADQLPEIEGLKPLYGKSVFHCPYCDGWEVRDQPLAAWGRGEEGVAIATKLVNWSADVVLCTDGPSPFMPEQNEELARHGVRVKSERIARLDGNDGRLEAVVFEDGTRLPRRALFFSAGKYLKSELPTKIGCTLTEKGFVKTQDCQACDVPGLYIAGDAAGATNMVVMAAADGASAAIAIHTSLAAEMAELVASGQTPPAPPFQGGENGARRD